MKRWGRRSYGLSSRASPGESVIQRGGLGSVGRAQLPQDPFDMHFHRVLGQEQTPRRSARWSFPTRCCARHPIRAAKDVRWHVRRREGDTAASRTVRLIRVRALAPVAGLPGRRRRRLVDHLSTAQRVELARWPDRGHPRTGRVTAGRSRARCHRDTDRRAPWPPAAPTLERVRRRNRFRANLTSLRKTLGCDRALVAIRRSAEQHLGFEQLAGQPSGMRGPEGHELLGEVGICRRYRHLGSARSHGRRGRTRPG